jgi:hypothetical protein
VGGHSAQGQWWIIFQGGMGRGVTSGVLCSSIHSAVSHKQLWSWLTGRNGPHYSVWHGVGRLSIQEIRMLHSLILIEPLFSPFWEKKKKEMAMGLFFQGQRPDMLCWLCLTGFSWLLNVIKT